MITYNLARIQNPSSLHTSTQMGKNGQSASECCILHLLVCCKACVNHERNKTSPMSKKGHNVITCNLLGIGDATSLHMSDQMVQRSPKDLQKCEEFIVFFLILGLARSLCPSTTPCNSSNVSERTHCDNMQPGVDW